MPETIDITPSPRILRTLGEIPFQPWQCIAELIDNSVDAFAEAERSKVQISEKKITVSWSLEGVAAALRTIEIIDSGPGMELSQIQNAARAGYSNNDPINNLGLFGMGFNIATARLGENTIFMSTTKESKEWTGIEIDFASLIKSKSFSVAVIREPKKSPSEHGTKVVVSKLRGETYAHLRDHESALRRQLENIYSHLLDKISVEIYVQGKKLSPKRHCVWSSSRYVIRDSRQIPAIVELNRDLGCALFDIERNSYLSRDDEQRIRENYEETGVLPPNIIERHKRLGSWIGIQRYSDPNDFGIDFIRNGRKILIGNKALFNYENPMTGTSTLEYPVELGSTVGGRIVGEVNVDYLLPTYQKNDFDRTDPSWLDTVEALRGVGPIKPSARKAMGYTDDNNSPIGMLANAFRRPEPGTKNLSVERGTARDFAERFRRGEPGFMTDDKCWEAALEADRLRATSGAAIAPVVDTGSTPSESPDEYAPGAITTPATSVSPTVSSALPIRESSKLDDLLNASRQVVSWSGSYVYGHVPPLQVKVRELIRGEILKQGDSVPCAFYMDGVECEFFYNPRHGFLTQFPIDPRQLLIVYLAETFKARDNLIDIGRTYSEITQIKMNDVRVDRAGLQERAAGVFDILKEKMAVNLTAKKRDVIECIHESIGEVEETVTSMLPNGKLIIKFQEMDEDGYEALQFVPYRTLLRIVDRFPEELFDGKVFSAPYSNLKLSDQQANERAKNESKDRIMSFLKDGLWVLSYSGTTSLQRAKDELARCAHSINFLYEELSE